MKLKNGKELTSCPHCGYDQFEVSVKISGRGGMFFNFNPELDGDNTHLHDCLTYKTGKRAKCGNCRKSLGTLNEAP